MIRWSRPAPSEAERQRRVRFTRWMETYWAHAQAWWEHAEKGTALYPAELTEYRRQHPRPTLKQHMIGTRGQPR